MHIPTPFFHQGLLHQEGYYFLRNNSKAADSILVYLGERQGLDLSITGVDVYINYDRDFHPIAPGCFVYRTRDPKYKDFQYTGVPSEIYLLTPEHFTCWETLSNI